MNAKGDEYFPLLKIKYFFVLNMVLGSICCLKATDDMHIEQFVPPLLLSNDKREDNFLSPTHAGSVQ